jgi:hypothetical protein
MGACWVGVAMFLMCYGTVGWKCATAAVKLCKRALWCALKSNIGGIGRVAISRFNDLMQAAARLDLPLAIQHTEPYVDEACHCF